MVRIYEMNDNVSELNKRMASLLNMNKQIISINNDINITNDYSLLVKEKSTFEAIKFISVEPCVILEQDVFNSLITEHATNAYNVMNTSIRATTIYGNADNRISETIYSMLNLEANTNVEIDVDFENVSNESKIHIRKISRNFLSSHQAILLKMYPRSVALKKYYK